MKMSRKVLKIGVAPGVVFFSLRASPRPKKIPVVMTRNFDITVPPGGGGGEISELKHVGRERDAATANKFIEPNDCRRKPVVNYPSYENNTV